MSFHRNSVVVLCLSLVATACSGGGGGTPVSQATPVPTPTPTLGPAVTIMQTGSTNTQAFTIVLQTNASAKVTQGSYTGSTTISASDAAKFFSDLNANVPISNVATTTCAKPSSFATQTILTYEGVSSGDISCFTSTGSPQATLYTDEQAVVTDIHAKLSDFNPS